MAGQSSTALGATYDILLTDADGRHLPLESFKDLESARQRFPNIAAEYPGTRITLWNRETRAVLAESDGY